MARQLYMGEYDIGAAVAPRPGPEASAGQEVWRGEPGYVGYFALEAAEGDREYMTLQCSFV